MTSIQFESINLATYLVYLGYQLNILRPMTGTRAMFEFMETPELIAAIVGYERGDSGAKRLLDTRGRLYKAASACVRNGVKP